MPKAYNPTKDPVTKERVGKTLNDVVTQAKKDRKRAEELYEFCSKTAKGNPDNPDLVKQAIDALKVLQASHDKVLKATQLMQTHLKEAKTSEGKAEGKKRMPSFADFQQNRD